MELLAVNSSNLKAIGYDRRTKTLRIQFVEGSSYDYAAVPASLHGSLMAAESKGSFFQEHVVGKFKYAKGNLEKERNQMKNNQQKQAEARAKAAAPNAAQPVAEAPKPATPAQPAAQPTKQQETILKLTVALREQRQIEVKPEMLVQDGKFINLLIGKTWPTIRVGTSGGITVVELKSYASAFDAAIKGDELLAKQNARDAKKTATPAPTPASAPVVKETPTAKKAKAHAAVEKQLEAATA